MFNVGDNIASALLKSHDIESMATIIGGFRHRMAEELRKMEKSWPVKDAMIQIGCLEEVLDWDLPGEGALHNPEPPDTITITTGSDCV